MKKLLLFIIPLIATLIGCSKPALVVLLDGWWDADYAKQACPPGKPCVPDPVQAVRDFETELTTQFAAQPACNSVQFVRFDSPTDNNKASSDATQKKYWNLSLNFSLGAAKQQWQMIDAPSHTAVTKGEGSPVDIAKVVCSIVNGRGAKLLN